MLRQIVNLVPTWPLALLAAFILGAISFAALSLVRRRWPDLQSGEHNDATAAVVTLAGTLYAIVLGFVIVTNYTTLNQTNTAVHTEAAQLTQLYVDVGQMPGVTEPVIQLMSSYVHQVVESDWPAMQSGDVSDVQDEYLQQMVSVMKGYEPQTQSQQIYYADAVAQINDIIESRQLRLTAADQDMPSALLGMILLGALLTVALSLAFGVKRFAVHVLLVCGASAFVAFTVVLAVALGYPFSGDTGIGNEMYSAGALSALWQTP